VNFSTLWAKIEAWIAGKFKAAEVVFTADEQALLTLMQPLLAAAEAAALADLVTFIRGVLSQASTAKDLASWETAILNALEATGSSLLAVAKALGSNLLQALIAFVLAQLPAVHPASPS
jgi:hypothetical protein